MYECLLMCVHACVHDNSCVCMCASKHVHVPAYLVLQTSEEVLCTKQQRKNLMFHLKNLMQNLLHLIEGVEGVLHEFHS